MKNRFLFLLFIFMAAQVMTYAQGSSDKQEGHYYYSFKFLNTDTGDSTVSRLYCVFALKPLKDFQQLSLTYNDKEHTYKVADLLQGTDAGSEIKGNHLYVTIDEKLSTPYVVVTATDEKGKQYSIWQKNARGEVIDPGKGQRKWKQAMQRIESIDRHKYDKKGEKGQKK